MMMMMVVVMVMSILTSPSPLLPAAFYSYTPHLPSSPLLDIFLHSDVSAGDKDTKKSANPKRSRSMGAGFKQGSGGGVRSHCLQTETDWQHGG
jgi:hypothetical protein